jgi:steroid delta-isomerase-like uncharacterized protein
MGEDAKKIVYRRFVEEVINDGNIDIVPELFSKDYIDHTRPPGAPEGLDGVRMIPKMFRGAFPDLHFTLADMVSEGDIVATRVTGHGTNDGSFLGMPPTNREATWASMGFFRVRDGKISEHWGVPDLLTLMTHLGVIPAPGDGAPASPPPTPAVPPADAGPPDPEANKAIMRHYVEDLVNQHDLSELDRWFVPDYIDHVMGRDILGPEGYRQSVQPLWQGFPDVRYEIQQMVAEGDRVATLFKATGTHQGAFFGVPPTGKPIEIYGITIERIVDGKLYEGWSVPDMLGLMQQIGAVPTPGAPEPART